MSRTYSLENPLGIKPGDTIQTKKRGKAYVVHVYYDGSVMVSGLQGIKTLVIKMNEIKSIVEKK